MRWSDYAQYDDGKDLSTYDWNDGFNSKTLKIPLKSSLTALKPPLQAVTSTTSSVTSTTSQFSDPSPSDDKPSDPLSNCTANSVDNPDSPDSPDDPDTVMLRRLAYRLRRIRDVYRLYSGK